MLRLNSHTSRVLRPCHRLLVYWVNDTLSSAEVLWLSDNDDVQFVTCFMIRARYCPWRDRISLVAGVVTATGVKYLPHASQKLVCSIGTCCLSYSPNSWLNKITDIFLFAALSGN